MKAQKSSQINLLFNSYIQENQIYNFEIKCFQWTTISELKKVIQSEIKITHRLGQTLHNQSLTFKPHNNMGVSVQQKTPKINLNEFILVFKGIQLNRKNNQLKSYGIQNLDKIQIYRKNKVRPVTSYDILCDNNKSESLQQLLNLKEINSSIHINKPELTESGTTGSYILKNKLNQGIGIFKPIDEEYNAPNNPKGNIGRIGEAGPREGIFSGECAYREVAAYIIDQQSQGKFNVPKTNMVNISHSSFSNNKEGSLQLFVQHLGNFADYPIQMANIDEIHRIGILDIRILNCDRNEENILFAEQINDSNGYPVEFKKLIPIDHGLSFSSKLCINEYEVAWMDRKFDVPFNEENLEIINQINIEKDISQLKKHLNISEQCLKLVKIATLLLKRYAKTMSLYKIGKLIYRVDDDKPSVLENIIEQADNLYNIQLKVNKHKNSKIQVLQQTTSLLVPATSQKSDNSKDDSQDDDQQLMVLELAQSNSQISESDQEQDSILNNEMYFQFINNAMDLLIDSSDQQE